VLSLFKLKEMHYKFRLLYCAVFCCFIVVIGAQEAGYNIQVNYNKVHSLGIRKKDLAKRIGMFNNAVGSCRIS
jgi:hypothetical protein